MRRRGSTLAVVYTKGITHIVMNESRIEINSRSTKKFSNFLEICLVESIIRWKICSSRFHVGLNDVQCFYVKCKNKITPFFTLLPDGLSYASLTPTIDTGNGYGVIDSQKNVRI